MSNSGARVGSALRLLASGGWADQDSDVLMDLVQQARALAAAVIDDAGASEHSRLLARRFLDEVREDLLDR
ncbi:MAG: hypothetical protein ACYDAC_02925 [Candidatus Dormibacteria bacterium]